MVAARAAKGDVGRVATLFAAEAELFEAELDRRLQRRPFRSCRGRRRAKACAGDRQRETRRRLRTISSKGSTSATAVATSIADGRSFEIVDVAEKLERPVHVLGLDPFDVAGNGLQLADDVCARRRMSGPSGTAINVRVFMDVERGAMVDLKSEISVECEFCKSSIEIYNHRFSEVEHLFGSRPCGASMSSRVICWMRSRPKPSTLKLATRMP